MSEAWRRWQCLVMFAGSWFRSRLRMRVVHRAAGLFVFTTEQNGRRFSQPIKILTSTGILFLLQKTTQELRRAHQHQHTLFFSASASPQRKGASVAQNEPKKTPMPTSAHLAAPIIPRHAAPNPSRPPEGPRPSREFLSRFSALVSHDRGCKGDRGGDRGDAGGGE